MFGVKRKHLFTVMKHLTVTYGELNPLRSLDFRSESVRLDDLANKIIVSLI